MTINDDLILALLCAAAERLTSSPTQSDIQSGKPYRCCSDSPFPIPL